VVKVISGLVQTQITLNVTVRGANVYLHYVLDRWLEDTVKSRLQGRAMLVRFADDFVIVFTSKRDADRVMAVLPLIGREGDRQPSSYGL